MHNDVLNGPIQPALGYHNQNTCIRPLVYNVKWINGLLKMGLQQSIIYQV